jgi:hypothetical protein
MNQSDVIVAIVSATDLGNPIVLLPVPESSHS